MSEEELRAWEAFVDLPPHDYMEGLSYFLAGYRAAVSSGTPAQGASAGKREERDGELERVKAELTEQRGYIDGMEDRNQANIREAQKVIARLRSVIQRARAEAEEWRDDSADLDFTREQTRLACAAELLAILDSESPARFPGGTTGTSPAPGGVLEEADAPPQATTFEQDMENPHRHVFNLDRRTGRCGICDHEIHRHAGPDAPPQAEPDEPSEDERAWLIEGPTREHGQTYVGADRGRWRFVPLSLAMRFARRRDAEDAASMVEEHLAPLVRVAEHAWVAPPSSEAAGMRDTNSRNELVKALREELPPDAAYIYVADAIDDRIRALIAETTREAEIVKEESGGS